MQQLSQHVIIYIGQKKCTILNGLVKIFSKVINVSIILVFINAGAHTIGQTHCQFVSYRLYNFTTTGNADPSISPSALTQLQTVCPDEGDGSKEIALDTNSHKKFDANFFKNVRDGNAILESDQRLWGDSETQKMVKSYAGSFRGLLGMRFYHEFQKAMVKMSSIEVKTGTEGEIRKTCSRVNLQYY